MFSRDDGFFINVPRETFYGLSFCTCRIHLDGFGVVLDAPDTAGADTGADTTANALIGVRDVFPAAIFLLNAGDGLFRTGLQAHLTVTAGTAADAAGMVVYRIAQQAVMAFVEVSLGQALRRNLCFLREGLYFLAHHILVHIVSCLAAAADGIGQAARLDGITSREYALSNGQVSLGHQPALQPEPPASEFR